jgi:hypothetical protein
MNQLSTAKQVALIVFLTAGFGASIYVGLSVANYADIPSLVIPVIIGMCWLFSCAHKSLVNYLKPIQCQK